MLFGITHILDVCCTDNARFVGRTLFAPTDLLPWFCPIYIQFSSCVRGVTLGIMPLVAYTQNIKCTPRFDTSSLRPVPESLIVFTKSQGLYVPASIKTLSTYTRKVPLLLHKKCNNCRNVAKLKDKSFVCTRQYH